MGKGIRGLGKKTVGQATEITPATLVLTG